MVSSQDSRLGNDDTAPKWGETGAMATSPNTNQPAAMIITNTNPHPLSEALAFLIFLPRVGWWIGL